MTPEELALVQQLVAQGVPIDQAFDMVLYEGSFGDNFSFGTMNFPFTGNPGDVYFEDGSMRPGGAGYVEWGYPELPQDPEGDGGDIPGSSFETYDGGDVFPTVGDNYTGWYAPNVPGGLRPEYPIAPLNGHLSGFAPTPIGIWANAQNALGNPVPQTGPPPNNEDKELGGPTGGRDLLLKDILYRLLGDALGDAGAMQRETIRSMQAGKLQESPAWVRSQDLPVRNTGAPEIAAILSQLQQGFGNTGRLMGPGVVIGPRWSLNPGTGFDRSASGYAETGRPTPNVPALDYWPFPASDMDTTGEVSAGGSLRLDENEGGKARKSQGSNRRNVTAQELVGRARAQQVASPQASFNRNPAPVKQRSVGNVSQKPPQRAVTSTGRSQPVYTQSRPQVNPALAAVRESYVSRPAPAANRHIPASVPAKFSPKPVSGAGSKARRP